MRIDLTAFAEAFATYVCHICAGIAADADNTFHIENDILREAHMAGELDVDSSSYHAALLRRDATHDNFIGALRRYRVVMNSDLSDSEVDYLIHQKLQQWVVEQALHLSAPPSLSLAYDATRDVWMERKTA